MKGSIPQGSALGPLLFLVYVNGMSSQTVHGRLLQYATALICTGSSVDEVYKYLSQYLSNLLIWIKQSKMHSGNLVLCGLNLAPS